MISYYVRVSSKRLISAIQVSDFAISCSTLSRYPACKAAPPDMKFESRSFIRWFDLGLDIEAKSNT